MSISNHGAFTRTATEDVEVGGMVIKAGEAVILSLAAANYDATVFDCPERLDVTRDASGHVAFGHRRTRRSSRRRHTSEFVSGGGT